MEAANLVSKHLQEPVFIYCEDFELPHIGPRYLFKHRYGSCMDAADIVTYTFRAIGIPCMEDTDARGRHVWNVVRDTDGKDVPIWYIASEAVRGSQDTGGYKRGKAYRYMYGFQKDKVKSLGEDWQSMPLLFYHPYMKDVSEVYYPDTLRMPASLPDNEPYYLAHFHEARWWSCAYTRPVEGKIEIPHLESELVYLPMIYDKGNYQPAGFPFWFAGGEVTTFHPDPEKMVKVRLYRKYPIYGWLRGFMESVVRGGFEGSMTKDFANSKILYEANKKYIGILYNLLVYLAGGSMLAIIIWLLLQIFVFASFSIPTDSMEPTGGDNCYNSQDSRYWGLLPEEYIVGKATWIWKSKNKRMDEIRWNRVFKKIE